MILDIHTHRPVPYSEGIVDASASVIAGESFPQYEGQLYSVGIHPWNTAQPLSETFKAALAEAAARPDVAAIGEAGLDTLKGGPMFRQLQAFRFCIDLSERLHKPLIVHCVKAEDMIIGLRRELSVRQHWLIHGFRKKPAAAGMLAASGLWLSFGENFNADTVRSLRADRLLAETDESPAPVKDIIRSISDIRGEDMLPVVAANAAAFLRAE